MNKFISLFLLLFLFFVHLFHEVVAMYSEDEDDDGGRLNSDSWTGKSASDEHLQEYRRLQEKAVGDIQTFTVARPGSGRKNAVDNAMPNGGGEVVQPPTLVPLDDYYSKVFSEYIRKKFENDEDSEDDDDEDRHHHGRNVHEGDECEEDYYNDDDGDEEEDYTSKKRKRHDDDGGGGDGRRKKKKDYHIRTRDECFLCAWGNKFHDGIEAPHICKLEEIIKLNYGVHHNKEIAMELHLYFMEEIYDPSVGMKILTKEIALEHIEGLHTLNARIFVGENIKEEKKIQFLFRNAIWRSDGTFDKIAALEYGRSSKRLWDLYLMPIPKMNFNEGNSMDDMKRAADLFKLQAKFDQVQRKKQRKNLSATSTHKSYL